MFIALFTYYLTKGYSNVDYAICITYRISGGYRGGGGVIGGPPPPLGFLPPLYIITILATTIDYKYLNIINYIGIWCYLLIDFSVVQYFFSP